MFFKEANEKRSYCPIKAVINIGGSSGNDLPRARGQTGPYRRVDVWQNMGMGVSLRSKHRCYIGKYLVLFTDLNSDQGRAQALVAVLEIWGKMEWTLEEF